MNPKLVPPHGLEGVNLASSASPNAYLLVAISIALIGIAYLWWRRRSTIPKKESAADTMQGLSDRIDAMEMSHGAAPYCLGLSLALRQVLELGLKLPVSDWTTEEIKDQLPKKWPLTRNVNELLELFERMDQVKYRGLELSESEGQSLKADCRRWCDEMKRLEMLP